MIGDWCIVTQVRPHSDAEAKGVKPGAQILTLNGYTPTRDTLGTIQYIFAALRPQPSLRLGLQDPSGAKRDAEINTKFHQKKLVTDLTGAAGASDIWNIIRDEQTEEHLMRARSAELGDQILVLKLPAFDFTSIEVGEMIAKARKHQALIVDLRGNSGGSIETLRYLIGGVFDKEVKIADRVGRKESKPEIAKPAREPFTGKIVVLVDNRSASASELFARVMQIEKRGTVIGDHTSGSVM